jgi:hypothetical protein
MGKIFDSVVKQQTIARLIDWLIVDKNVFCL